jgi:hypothetical protein
MGKTFPLSRETKPEKQKAHGLNAHAQTTMLLYHKLRFFGNYQRKLPTNYKRQLAPTV